MTVKNKGMGQFHFIDREDFNKIITNKPNIVIAEPNNELELKHKEEENP